MIRVTAPSRLHFGLLSLPAAGRERWPGLDGHPGLSLRHFGGVGLMIDHPGTEVMVSFADDWSVSGPLASRAESFARRVVETFPEAERRPLRIELTHVSPEHAGLGTGTQLGLAIARGVCHLMGASHLSAVQLAARVGRGERSAIGVHGFDHGGLIVEGGKLPGEAISPLIGHWKLPEEWAVLVLTPAGSSDWHGARERAAFTNLRDQGPSAAETESLCRVVLMGMLPALISRDLATFGEAVYELNARVGDVFAAAQGGRYASPAIAELVAHLREMGVHGVGQSSWGPTVFAIVHENEVERVQWHISEVSSIVARPASGHIVRE